MILNDNDNNCCQSEKSLEQNNNLQVQVQQVHAGVLVVQRFSVGLVIERSLV